MGGLGRRLENLNTPQAPSSTKKSFLDIHFVLREQSDETTALISSLSCSKTDW